MTFKTLWIVAWLLTGVFLHDRPARSQPPEVVVEASGAVTRDAGGERADDAGTVTLNFDGADLVEVIHVFARHLRFNFTIDPDVRGAVTIFSGRPVGRADLLPIFHELLRIHDAVAIKRGDLYRITTVARGLGAASPSGGRDAGFAMRIAPVRFFPAAAMKGLLAPFLGEGGTILEHARGNYLVIVDLPSNIRRLVEIMELIDVEVFAGTRMDLYEPRAAAAQDLARELSAAMRLFAAAEVQGDTFAARFLPLPRINRLLVVAYSEAAGRYVRRWLERLDVASRTAGRKVFIRPVENGDAVALARVLNRLYGPGKRSVGKTKSLSARRRLNDLPDLSSGGEPDDAPGTTGFGRDPGSGESLVPESASPFGGDPAGAFRLWSGAPGVSTESSMDTPPATDEDVESVRVVAEPATNSLVILATRRQYLQLAEVLAELDAVPRQVLMEVLVAEVTLADEFALGVEHALSKGGFPPPSEAEGNTAGAPLGAGFQALESGFTSIVDAGREFRVFVNALMQDARVKVLSSPHLLALDNRPARIRVGSEQPVATGTVVSQEAQAVTTTIQFRNVGRILTIVPRVSDAGMVNLQVRVEVSDVGERVAVGSQTFDAFNIRDAETTAVLQDGQTLVIGGIITDNRRKTRVGIPLLMDVPVLGQLFRTDLERSDRTELVILITPRVIRNHEEGKAVTERFLDKVRAVRRELESRQAP